MNIGVFCPDWIIAKHNTDHKVVKNFLKINEFAKLNILPVASKKYTLGVNLNKIVNKLTGVDADFFLNYSLKKEASDIDVIYHYSKPQNPQLFFDAFKEYKTVITTGFMTDRYMRSKLNEPLDRQKEADELARSLERASMLHFHTEGGRQRFLKYRPEFEVKTTSAPFFLPSLPLFDIGENNTKKNINILFVGNDGKRKGLFDLMKAFDILGKEFLESYNIDITIVSKDKVSSNTGITFNWFEKLEHSAIIELMKKASIFVLVPERESYGLVLLEAMMAGCAIVTDNDDTRKEIVGDTGILLNKRAPNNIAKNLKELIVNDALRNTLGVNANKKAKEIFHPSVVAAQYASIFKKLID